MQILGITNYLLAWNEKKNFEINEIEQHKTLYVQYTFTDDSWDSWTKEKMYYEQQFVEIWKVRTV